MVIAMVVVMETLVLFVLMADPLSVVVMVAMVAAVVLVVVVARGGDDDGDGMR